MIRKTSLLFLALSSCVAAAQVDPGLYSGLVWRNLGPFRGGRVAAVSGAIGQPGVYYMGLPLGGVWKTTSAGATWYPVFDDIKEASSVGSLEVAPSDPNVIYVGMGDLITGGGINEGNGVYKSVDAGKTWQHLGLDETKQIPSILVDPHNPNLVMVAAQGNIREKSDKRGLYRSTDGGQTWTKTLYVDEQTGIQKITWAYDHPEVMLATTVRHYSPPGQGGRGGGGAPTVPGSGTKVFKSTDEGVTWKEITGSGLPSLSGRTCVAIAMNTNAQRMFLVGNFGLYRSDDGGGHWRQMDPIDRRVMNGQGGYNCGVYVNPKNPDTVYVINTCSYVSTDGGNTFTGFKGAPGGDDPQQMWLDPTDGNRLFFGTDQGATVSLDGGKNWSPWYNQSTAQVYHISVDNQFPYWVYASQQDSGSIGTSSRGNLGAITPLDWLPHPGYEFGSVVADPLNPKVSYAGGPSGGIIKVTYPSGQWVNVSPNLDSAAALRKVGNQPLMFNPNNPRELMAGFQYLMATTDGGLHWSKLSPDLGMAKGAPPAKPGVAPPPRIGGQEVFGDDEEREMEEQQANAPGGSIESFSVSTVNPQLIWVGTSNGLVKLTKDHGKSWADVSIAGLPATGDISGIDASHHDAAEAYAAVDNHRAGDLAPSFYRTRDYGKTWTKIVQGLPTDLPSGSFARVIKSDTVRKGLVFAATESFVYVSFDDGEHWQSLAQNLPNTSYRDMVVHGNDLIVGTYGRGFWVLDDISPLRQITSDVTKGPAYLFRPAEAVRVRRNVNGDTPFPPEVPHAVNPPSGAILYYYLSQKPRAPLVVEVRDARGVVVRRMSSALPVPTNDPAPPIPDFWVQHPKPLPTEIGTNRMSWDLRYDNPPAFNRSYEINANPGETPMSPQAPLAAPGEYTVSLIVDGQRYTQPIRIVNDPRSPATSTDLRAQCELQRELLDCVHDAWNGYQQVAKLRSEVADTLKANPSDEIKKATEDFDGKLSSIVGSSGGRRFGGGFGQPGTPPPPPSFIATHGALLRLLDELDSGDMAPSEPLSKAAASACRNLEAVKKAWKVALEKDLPAFNAALERAGAKPVAAPYRTVASR